MSTASAPFGLEIRTWLHLVQQGYIALTRAIIRIRDVRDHVQVFHMVDLLIQRGELVEVRREEAEGVDL